MKKSVYKIKLLFLTLIIYLVFIISINDTNRYRFEKRKFHDDFILGISGEQCGVDPTPLPPKPPPNL